MHIILGSTYSINSTEHTIYCVRGYNHSKNVDDEELPEQLILDDQQNGLHNQQDEQDWRQDGDKPIWIPTGTSDIGAILASISCDSITYGDWAQHPGL